MERLEHQKRILDSAEYSSDLNHALETLRQLGFDDFGGFLFSLPDPAYPHLSEMLPRMASEETQARFVAYTGDHLLEQSLAFLRLLESIAIRELGTSLRGRRVLDFGCGFGRLMRLLLYWTNPDNLVGVDPWDVALDLCRSHRVLGALIQSDYVPNGRLPVRGIDVAYAYSVLTHTSEPATLAVLSRVREALRNPGIFVCTIRPVEFWTFVGEQQGRDTSEMIALHRSRGFAFDASVHEHFGDTSIAVEYLETVPGWKLVGCERLFVQPHQLVITLRTA